MSAKQSRGTEHPNAVLLCIDDDEDLLDCLKSLLERHGYCVLAASSGRRGLEIFTAHRVDLVVLDYKMPGMNGPQVASAIKRMRPQTPIVLNSGSSEIPGPDLKFVDAFVQKGHESDSLLSAIAGLVSHVDGIQINQL